MEVIKPRVRMEKMQGVQHDEPWGDGLSRNKIDKKCKVGQERTLGYLAVSWCQCYIQTRVSKVRVF